MFRFKVSMASGVYWYRNRINGKIYIGRTKDLKKRKREHHWYYCHENNRYDKYLYQEMRMYGYENFEYKVLEYCDVEKLDEREIYYISLFGTTNEDKGYNITRGGKTGNVGRSFAVYKIDINTKEILDEYISIGEAGRLNDLFSTGIWKACVGKATQCGGYYWCYASDYMTFKFQQPILKGKQRCKPIYQLDKENNIIAEYESITKASKAVGKDANGIRNCLCKLSNTAYGYKWAYKEV